MGAWVGVRPIDQLAIVPDQLEAFVSLIAFVRGEIDALTLEGRLHLNLDAPDGIAFDQGATWAASLTVGWTP